MHAAGQEKVLSAEANPDVTLNKVINKEQGYIEWNYTFNAAKDRDSSSSYYWFMLPEVEQVGLPYDWQINTYKHQLGRDNLIENRTDWVRKSGTPGKEGKLWKDPYPFAANNRENGAISDLGNGYKTEVEKFRTNVHATSSSLSWAYIIQVLEGGQDNDVFKYWTVSFKTPIVKGIDPEKITYVYGFDNTRQRIRDRGAYNATFGGEWHNYNDKVILNKPVKTEVANPDNLTTTEKNKVIDEIKKANPHLPKDTTIVVSSDGTATVTYPDKSTETIRLDDTIKLPLPTPTINEVKTHNTTISGRGEPGATVKVTIPGVEEPIEAEVGQDGNWSVNVPSGKTLSEGDVIRVVQDKAGYKTSPEANTTVVKSDADKTEVSALNPKVKVNDTSALTPAEKKLVEDEVKKQVPSTATVVAGNDGSVTITYADGSVDRLTGAQTVEEKVKAPNPTVNPVKAEDRTITGTGTPGGSVTVKLPNGDTVKVEVGEDGNWTVNIPDGVTLNPNDTVKVIQEVDGKQPSEEVTVAVGEKDNTGDQGGTKAPNPTVNPVKAEATTITGGYQIPKTGETPDSSLYALLLLISGLSLLVFVNKRRAED